MKTMVCLAAALALVSGRAFAAPCASQSWSKYLELKDASTDCTIGSYKLSDFSFDAGNSGLTAEKITAQPSGRGLLFQLEDFKVVNPIQGLTSNKNLTIDFKIMDGSGDPSLSGIVLQMAEPSIDNGDATIEDVINGFNVNFLASRLTATKSLSPPASMVMVENRLTVATGMNLGASSQITQFSVNFAIVPEPGSLALVVSGLAMVALARRRVNLWGRGPAA